jgi:hypothetical protein
MSEPSSFGYVHPNAATPDVVDDVQFLADLLTEIVQVDLPDAVLPEPETP